MLSKKLYLRSTYYNYDLLKIFYFINVYRIHFWVAGTNGNTFKLSQLTKMLYDQEDCDHLSMFTFNEQALWIFTNGGRYVTTSNFDARLQLGK